MGRSSHTCVGRSSQGYPDSCLSPTSREGAQACADSPVLLENLLPPSSYRQGPVSPPSGTLLGPCAGVCVGGGAQWEGRGRRPIGQVHPQGTWHRVAEETSGLQQGEAKPSDEERPSHRCGCLVLGAASGRRAFPAGEGTRGAARREPAGAERAWTRKPWAESAQVT